MQTERFQTHNSVGSKRLLGYFVVPECFMNLPDSLCDVAHDWTPRWRRSGVFQSAQQDLLTFHRQQLPLLHPDSSLLHLLTHK